ncbi:hypothetical protein AK830_g1268 [Neonectria ditissima]|uniref:SCP domain-containing protein n=1 Tax=Neonectria ditissima TaxID=78410 RepID=A0A0P7BV35_9HYPO|nr:hypothetical protein AK830_g1268 [Neonectria ditissima]
MHFSAVVVSMLAANAAAWRFPHRHTHYVTEIVTVAGPTVTEVAGAVQTTVITQAAAAPTTLVTKKVSTTKKATSTKTTAVAVKTTAAEVSTDSSLTTDQQAALDAHNAARSAVGNPDLVWDATLASGAQEWATHLVSLGTLEHSGADGLGENLYMQYGTDSPYANAVAAFVEEKSSYNGETISESNYMTFGHYTQVIWKSTTKVGMAIASGTNGKTYVVARYSPPGNYIGEKPY